MSMTLRQQLPYEKFVELYVKENRSLSSIGKQYGVSRQRIHQLKKDYESIYGEITRRKTIDLFTLKKYLDQKYSVREIALKHNMTSHQVTNQIKQFQWMHEQGILPISVKINKAEDILPKPELVELYCEELLTDDEIGEIKRLSPSTVSLLRKKYNITTIYTKSLRKLPKKLPKDLFDHYYYVQKMKLSDIAKKVKCSEYSLIKLKQMYER